MRPNINDIKKMQQRMAKIQEELETETVEASSGGGVVTVTMTGHQKVVGIKISPEAIDPDDPGMLEDLILAAVNEAVQKSQDLVTKRMGQLTGGLRIPGLT
jgi:DNA-binding YbaB/EbfC family protein